MKLFSGPTIGTPFGKVKLPDCELPPLELPTRPDEHARKAILHGVGEDLSGVIGLIPWIGDLVADAIADTHHAEIKKLLTSEEYDRFAEFNKSLPTAPALIRTFCFIPRYWL